MPTFREVNTGQIVQLEDDPSYLDGLARWERISEGLSAPTESDTVADSDAQLAEAEAEAAKALAEAQTDAAEKLAELNAELAGEPVKADPVPAVLELPTADADRDEWVSYALANGKTAAEIKGVRLSVIQGWFEK